MLRDIYFPYVGMEDHIAYQHLHRIGVFVDHKFSWLYDGHWKHTTKYVKDTVVTDSNARNDDLKLAFHFNDFVYPTENVSSILVLHLGDHLTDQIIFDFGLSWSAVP